ncbi:unnamed protein product [Camellia sinensis]
MSLRGIEFHTEESPQAILKSADGSLSLKTNKGTVEGFSHIMFATGHKPNTKNLGLMSSPRTSVPSIWAVGDVTDRVNLTPDALMEGGALGYSVCCVFPATYWTSRPYRRTGAVNEYGDVDIFTANFRPLKATLSGLPDRVFMKLIVCAKTNKVLGLHMCGEDSPEIVVAVKAGLTKAELDATVGIHPTSAEEFVTMRTPTRKIRNGPPPEVLGRWTLGLKLQKGFSIVPHFIFRSRLPLEIEGGIPLMEYRNLDV